MQSCLLEKTKSDYLAPSKKESRLLFPVIRNILELPTTSHQTISVQGWIKSIRKQKKVCFVELIDGSSPNHLQLVISPQDFEERPLEIGSSIRVFGNLIQSKGARQSKELQVKSIEVIGACPNQDYPLHNKEHSVAFLRKIPHLRLRMPTNAALLRLRSSINLEIDSFFQSHGFFRTEPPILTFSDCEGAGEVFKVDPEVHPDSTAAPKPAVQANGQPFFGRQAYLTVSAQLHLEALSAGIGRVYSFGPTFRAERSRTNRHLAEFWMLEAEMSFCDDLDPVMTLVERFIHSVLERLYHPENLIRQDLELLGAPLELSKLSGTRWRRMTYTEAVKILQAHHRAQPNSTIGPVAWGEPLSSDQEKWLSGSYVRGPTFVTDYPQCLKPFYMRRSLISDDEDFEERIKSFNDYPTVACFDLLIPGIGELAGGSLREPNLKTLHSQMTQKGIIKPDQELGFDSVYQWYADLRKYGAAPSGGFGIGWERLISWISGQENVRECIPFPRVVGSNRC